jgi:AcrR family transcriptional regulator
MATTETGSARPSTRSRVESVALVSFGTRGYDATSLDALAHELGVTKQTILYYHPSKEALLEAVIANGAVELATTLEEAVRGAGPGFARIEAIVRAVFRLALRRPELLGLLREMTRLGPPYATRLVTELEPLVAPAVAWLEAEMAAGRLRRLDARLLLVSVYSTIIGTATEVEVLRAVGIEPTMRSLAIRRRELLRFLRSALLPDEIWTERDTFAR